MLNNKLFEELGNKVSETLSNSPVKDLEKNAKAALSSVLGKMDMVSREELLIQEQILLKTREQLTLLEERVAQLEAALQTAKHTQPE